MTSIEGETYLLNTSKPSPVIRNKPHKLAVSSMRQCCAECEAWRLKESYGSLRHDTIIATHLGTWAGEFQVGAVAYSIRTQAAQRQLQGRA
jgi:hypothetical protein